MKKAQQGTSGSFGGVQNKVARCPRKGCGEAKWGRRLEI